VSFKVAFLGSHGVGKTTLCYGLAARLKARDLAVEVVHEVARRSPLPINRETSLDAQSWIFHSQVAEEIVAASRYPVVLCDRSLLDNYVYLLLAAGRQEHLEGFLSWWLTGYDLLVHVPVLDRPNPDGIRSSDPAFQQAVEDRLRREIDERGLAVLRLEGDDRDAWLAAVESEVWRLLRPAQLSLLPE
jgi:nicotinamide riboside kinase